MKKQVTEMVTGNFYKFASQKRMDKPSRVRYIIYKQENILYLRIGKFNWILFTMIERTKHGGHITDVDGNIKAFPNY